MILVEYGNTSQNQSVSTSIYFIRVDLTNIIPQSVPDSGIINSIAQTLGLHDFYTVGLWGFCEGYNSRGVTACSKPKTLYWFDPVTILLSELLSGATIALPSDVTDILGLVETVSHWMFGLFLSGACLSFVMIFLTPLSVLSRRITILIGFLTFLAALLVTVGSVIATILFVLFQRAATSVTELNIGASLGIKMFVFMWIASGASIIAWLIQTGLCCCCASRRDVRLGKKKGSKKAWETETVGVSEKPAREGVLGRKN